MTNKAIYLSRILLIAVILISFSCSSKKDSVNLGTKPISIKQFDTPPGADPSVPADKGGKGFKGEGWVTNEKYNSIGKKESVKGGKFVFAMPDFPASFRTYGKDSNFELNDIFSNLIFESLLNMDPADNTLHPGLATHWKMAPDSLTYSFRINPDARWADGMPVTSQDFIATLKLMADTTMQQPYMNEFTKGFEAPVAESKYVFSIKSKTKNWRQLYYLTTFSLLPDHILKNLTGKDYLEQYQFKYLVGTGPYAILENDIKKGESITFRRRSDYWGENERYNAGKYNFDEITFTVVMDDLLQFEKFKKGELDYYSIRQPELWKTGFDFDYANRNIVLRKKIFNNVPLGPTGFALNMREYPFNDIRIRRAFMYLFDKKKLNEKLFDNTYTLFNSYFPNSEYANPSNPVTGYNYDSAMTLLNEAGWIFNKEKGTLEKDGKKFEVTIPFSKPMDQYLTIYQEELQKAGIKLNLKETDGTTRFSLGNDRSFTIIPMAWMGIVFPNPITDLSSESADMKNTNNWAGVKDKRIDSLCLLYDVAYTKQEQINILREIDKIAYSNFGLMDGFYRSYRTIAYQNKFGYPDGIISRYDRYSSIFYYWYIDPDKLKNYEKALNDKNMQLPKEELENEYWKKYESAK
ncbi:MAG: ABC transporter substrate-binding protein [Ignavibacteriota bacterium]